MQKRFLQLDNIFLPVSAAFGLVCLTWIIHKEKYTFLCACARQDPHKNPPKPKHKSCQIQVVKEPSQREGKGYSIMICSVHVPCSYLLVTVKLAASSDTLLFHFCQIYRQLKFFLGSLLYFLRVLFYFLFLEKF